MNSDLEIWNKAADVWSNKVTKDESLRTLQLKSALDDLLGNVTGKDILDAGSGDGVFTEHFSLKGAHAVGVEGAKELVKIAQTKYPNRNFQTHDLLEALPFANGKFDAVFANMVLMHLSQIDTFLSEVKRTLKPKGIFVFSILHPCFNFPTMLLYKSWWDKILMKKPSGLAFDYFQTGVSRRYESTTSRDLTHYHRTIEQYSQKLRQLGFMIEAITEPHELPKDFLMNNPKLEYATRLPRFLFIKAVSI
jgi:ubiquinone/menaquinone biosynthesis C-methylase UbiE